MEDRERLIGLVDWIAKNTNHNLNFIPDDKLDWHPAPQAKSALDIAHEIATSVDSIANLMKTSEYHTTIARPTSREEAQAAISAAAEAYITTSRSLSEERLAEPVDFFGMDMTVDKVLELPVIEATHHHGQIVYIQTLLGDTKDHFFQMDG
jgi:uncharacterized damage-inducible protein DinB